MNLTLIEPFIAQGTGSGKFYAADDKAEVFHGPYDTIEEARAVRESLEKSLATPCDGLGEV